MVDGGPPADGPGDPAPPEAAPFDAAWATAVRDDLARLRRTSPASQLYPWRWGAIASRLPGLARFHAWVGRGGRAEELPDEVRERARALDEEFAAAGYPRPFHPFVYARAKAGESAFPARLAEWLAEGVKITGVEPGWHGTAVDAFERYVILHDEHFEAARRDPVKILPPELEELRGRAVLAFLEEDELIVKINREAFATTEAGPALRAWMRPLAEAAALAAYAAARAVAADQGPYQELWAGFYAIAFHQIREAFFWDFASLPPEVALGGPPASVASWHLLAHFLDTFGDCLHTTNREAAREVDPHRAEVEAVSRVLELPARNGYGGSLKVNALRHAFLCPGRRADHAGLRAAMERFGGRLEAEGESLILRHWAAMDFAKEIYHRGMAETMTRDELQRVRRWLDAMAPGTLPAEDAEAQAKARILLDRVLAARPE